MIAIEFGNELENLEGADFNDAEFSKWFEEAKEKLKKGVQIKQIENLPLLDQRKRKRRKKHEILEMRKLCT